MPSLDSLKFDTTGFSDNGSFFRPPATIHEWLTPEGDGLNLVYIPRPPTPLTNATLEDLRAQCAAKNRNSTNPTIEEAFILPIGPLMGFRFLFKGRHGSGWLYAGRLIAPFRSSSYIVECFCPERGTTGTREAIVMYRQNSGVDSPGPAPATDMSPWNPDDERFDSVFPDHPLSRLRRYLRKVQDTVEIDSELLSLPALSQPRTNG
jgi:hypothetical protein